MLEPAGSPCRKILTNSGAFGSLLFDYLSSIINVSRVKNILEIGGGYGYLMRDFLSRKPDMNTVMLDISPFLINKQKNVLSGFQVEFIEKDFFSADVDFLSAFDLAVLNEIIGDFPALCNTSLNDIEGIVQDRFALEAGRLIKKYNLPLPDDREFSFNLGALTAVEMLCSAGVKYIYISEHSCEAVVPEKFRGKIDISSDGYPKKISLKGHDEYTIKFSSIEKIARYYKYRVKRGNYSDFLKINDNDMLNFILSSNSDKDDHEIIRHFVSDLFLYEYVVLYRS
jgi:hypothetical protein